MPNPTPERWKQIEAVVDVLLETPVSERDRVLAEICAGDPELRAEVEAVLSGGGHEGRTFDGAGLTEPGRDLRDRLKDALAGRYAIEREIGRGGMATVFLARDVRHDRQVALKVLRPELAIAVGTRRFLREVRIVAQLQHPHILPLFDSGEADGLLFYVVPWVEAGSLRRRLERERQISIDEALRIAREVADGLAHAHARGVIHRDIKPENILLGEGHAFIADFGIARALTVAGPAVTTAGGYIGTPLYMSPEQADGTASVDARTDIYSLACVLYEMLAGDPPFAGATRQAVVARHALEPVPSLRIVRETVPVALDEVIRRALAKVPADRFATVAEFAAALERAATAIPGPARSAAGGEPEPPAPARDRAGFRTPTRGKRDAVGERGSAGPSRPRSPWLRLWTEARRRQVHRTLILYAGAALGLFGIGDLLNTVGFLSDGAYRILGIGVLVSFPVVLVLAWVFDITPAGIRKTPPAGTAEERIVGWGWIRPVAEVALGAVLVGGLIVLAVRTFTGPVQASTPVPDYLVQAHRTDTTTPAEAEYALIAAEALTRLLSGWEGARAVPSVALPRLRSTLGLTDPVRADHGESLQLASLAGAGTLVTVTIDLRADSAYLEANLFRVGSGTPIGQPLSVAADTQRVSELVAPIAASILGLSGAPDRVGAMLLRRPSANLQALRQLQPGIESLNRWRLQSAERHFRSALALDSTLSLAHHYLALTLYARAVSGDHASMGIGGEIRRHVAAAVRHGGSLPYRDSLHVAALNAFQNGDYERSRRLYDTLVRGDSTDTYAWLLAGSVEVQDPWTVAARGNALVPRSNLNRALRAFTRTVRLSPDFFLGYAPLFDVFLELAGTMQDRTCPGFERPADRVVLIWDARSPGNMVFFCPVRRDSIEWVHTDALDRIGDEVTSAGAARFLDEASVELSRWAEYAPNDPKPHEVMARWLLARRRAMAWTGTSAGHDTLAARARSRLERALALRSDTFPVDLIRIASLYLQAGDHEGAARLTDQGIAELRREAAGQTARVPLEAVNVYLATGRLSGAIELVDASMARQTMSVEDPVTGRDLRFWVEPQLARIQVFGALGLIDRRVRDEFDAIERTWDRSAYDRRQVEHVRQFATRFAALGLALDGDVRRRWFRNADSLPALWQGLLAADPSARRRALELAVTELAAQPASPTQNWLVALLARHAGDEALAVSILDRFDELPLDVDEYSLGWGLRTLSHYQRGLSHEALGDPAAANGHYARFIELWDGADPELQPIVQQARNALGRLR